MPESKKRIVRKGRIYHLRVADVVYRTFIWQDGSGFRGRVEEHPEVPQCRGRNVVVVREQLCVALAASLETYEQRPQQ